MPRKPDPVNPCASPWHLLGAEMRYQRDEVRGLTLRQVAKLAWCDDADLSKWERGVTRPQPDTVRRLDEVYGANGRLIALHGIVAEVDRLRTLVRKETSDEVNTTERRRILQLAATSAGFSALGSTGEPLRQLLHMDLVEERTVEDWHLACDDQLNTLHTRPPAEARDDLQNDLAELQQQLRNLKDSSEILELRRVVAALSTLHANVLSRLGEHGAALRWWHTARAMADETGDLHLRLGVRATAAGHILGHGQRDPLTVLRLTEQARHIAGDARSLGTAFVLCSQAKALASAGRHAEARSTLRTCHDVMESEPPATSIMPYVWRMRGGQLEYAELWVSAEAGDESAAADACERVLSVVRDYQYHAMAHLQTALCTVICGGVDEGLRRASATIDDLPPRYRTHQINEIGRRILHAVPLDQRARPAVGEFREMLTLSPGPV
ncbi:helix-turn-helix transcriptional regulator [Thermopolyspora sp. NPDC052614]|uniref:helix-turn-helix domain-containing protein n=1 Tax=Thermopolyspora sp. NPDC052614 TaxID=3155682 RepID=UPI00342BD684